MQIVVEAKNVYGRVMYYPANEPARIASLLIGKQTFDKRDAELLKQLGHSVQTIQKPERSL